MSSASVFWLLAGTFFICGASTNGLIGTHLIAARHDYGIHRAALGAAPCDHGNLRHSRHDRIGMADGFRRYSSRHLLRLLHASRLSLSSLPFTLQDGANGLWLVRHLLRPRLGGDSASNRSSETSEAFGRENTGVIYGWIGASHQLGAWLAAFSAGAIRTCSGRLPARVSASPDVLCLDRRRVLPDDWPPRVQPAGDDNPCSCWRQAVSRPD